MFPRIFPSGVVRGFLVVIFLTSAFTAGAEKASAQSLNWEGQTGIFVTPLAYSVPGKQNGFDWPAVSYHFVDAGPVLGGFHQLSITEGAYDRFEFGYTRDFHQDGSTTGLSNLWGGGFNIFRGKVGILKEGRRIHPQSPSASSPELKCETSTALFKEKTPQAATSTPSPQKR